MTKLKAELGAWCQSYVTAFSNYDALGISSHWTFPALIVSSGRSLVFKSAEHFDQNTSALLGFYETQNVERAVRSVIDYLPLNAETVSMTVADQMLAPDGSVIVEWQAAYVLQLIDGKWRAVMALADGELEAWGKRGTPLGKPPK